ncbi:MAG: MerC domain-containing protein [Planctomycetota bacterium]
MSNVIQTTEQPSVADGAGLIASIACAIHCAAMPLVIGYLPMLGLSWLADPSFHRVMAVVCFGFALAAFVPGWRRHGSLTPTLFGIAGIAMLSVAAFCLEDGCCPACALEGSASASELACSDPECQSCQEEAVEAVFQPMPQQTQTAWYTPLITPLGGVLLVLGHVSNHRRSCQCCGRNGCEREPESLVEVDLPV